MISQLTVFVRPVSTQCDMACQYCYAPAPKKAAIERGTMSLAVARSVIEKTMAFVSKGCSFSFQGGEPTLAGLDFYRSWLELEAKLNTKQIPITHTIATNGMHIDDEWASFFKENKFHVDLSLDGPSKFHDFFRTGYAGGPTYARVISSVTALKRRKADFCACTVVTEPVASHPDDVWQSFLRYGIRNISFTPCLIDEKKAKLKHPPEYTLSTASYGNFLCKIFDYWYDAWSRDRFVSIAEFDNFAYKLSGFEPKNCMMRGTCAPHPVIESDGSVYPCEYYSMRANRLGSITDKSMGVLLKSPAASEFVTPSKQMEPACRVCIYRQACRGGCKHFRVFEENSIVGRTQFCESYKQFFYYSIERLRVVAKTLRH
jgi:uncharacterized protein